MASTPQFAATPNAGSVLVPATADTSLTAPSNVATVWTAGASGGKIEEIICQGVGTTVAGVVNIFRHDGSTYHLVDQFLVTAVTSSTTAVAYRLNKTYENLLLNASETLRCTITVAGDVSLIKVTALGGSF